MKNKKWVRHFGKVSGGKLKKHSGRKKWIALGLSVVLIGGAACGAFFRFRSHSLQAMAEDMAAQSAVVEKGDISTTVVGTGNLTGQSAEDVMIPTGVKVESVLAESGDHVKKGDVLAMLDAASVKQAMLEVQEEIETLDEEIEEARDDTASASVSAGVSGTVKTIYAKEEKKVSDIMAKKGALMILVMDDDSETEIAVTGAQGTISEICVSEGDEVDAGDQLIVLEDVSESAEYLGLVAERKELAEYLAELSSVAATNTVTAEFDGTIQDVNVSSSTASGSQGGSSGTGSVSGSLVSTSASSSSGSTDSTAGNQVVAFTVSPDESMTLSISVDELDILSVEKGQSADITFDALEDQTFTGTITSISDTASVSGGVAKYMVEIQVPRDENMRVGMNASATIKVEEKQDILLLPSIALQEKGETTFVYTSQEEDGTLSGEVEVETGLSDGSRVEIISGLSEGDTVYYTRVKNESTTTGFGRGGFGQGGFNKGTMPNMGDGGNRGNMMPPMQ